MGEPKDEISAAAVPDEEIELSAVDLVALAEPVEIATPDPAASQVTAAPLGTMTANHVPLRATPANTRNASAAIPRTAMLAGVAFVATAASIAIYTHAPSKPDMLVQDTWQPPFPRLPVAENVADEPPAQPQGPPVRYANPFDPNEVFEFPHGTSRAIAREQVAEVLRQRAIERLKSARK